ncbi:MAG: hypothetical protein J3K34DRAFT_98181 [Monoraphidium minutum]|nr:MAG: hypothetical protein J3K34DRAFT_98181 [Monoraphidium minutum]
MVSSDETEATTTVHTEPGGSEERDAWEPFRVASRNPQVPAYREWWRRNPLNNLRASGKANLWSRFQAEVVEGKTPLQASQGPHTQTLEDLKQVPLPSDLEDDAPSDELWWGTPDPSVYAPGTIHLDKRQIAEEEAKGNITTMARFRERLADAQDWELEVMGQLAQLHAMRHKMMLPMEDGTSVSLWDLYKYVRCNPQLEALAARGINSVEAGDGMTREDRIRLLEEVAPWTLDPEAETMQLPDRVAMGLPWGLLSSAPYYSRRPTRWLKGLDGRQDFAYGAYVHEQQASDVLGPKWAGRGAAEVLGSGEYFDDLLAAGPLVGLTLMAITSRQLPLEEAASAWGERLAQHMDRMQSSLEAGPSSSSPAAADKPCCGGGGGGGGGGAVTIPRPAFGPIDVSREKLRELAGLFDRGRLAEQTALLDEDGRELRRGAAILITAAPGGGVMVQAISPGKVREQEHYLLGAVTDARLTAALFDMFLHPQRGLNPGFAFSAGYQSLWFVNGFKSFNSDNNPNVRRAGDPGPAAPRLPRRGRGAVWALPPPGRDPSEAAPELVRGVKRRVMYNQVHEAFAAAWDAAGEVEAQEGMDEGDLALARRAAAEGALRRSLGGLGLNVQGLLLGPPPPEELDLASTAAPLQVP